LSNHSHYQRNPEFIFRKIVDESVLVPIHADVADMGCIYTLNDVGTFIWNQLGDLKSWDALLTAMLNEYEGDPEQMAVDLARFLEEMVAINAVRKV